MRAELILDEIAYLRLVRGEICLVWVLRLKWKGVWVLVQKQLSNLVEMANQITLCCTFTQTIWISVLYSTINHSKTVIFNFSTNTYRNHYQISSCTVSTVPTVYSVMSSKLQYNNSCWKFFFSVKQKKKSLYIYILWYIAAFLRTYPLITYPDSWRLSGPFFFFFNPNQFDRLFIKDIIA